MLQKENKMRWSPPPIPSYIERLKEAVEQLENVRKKTDTKLREAHLLQSDFQKTGKLYPKLDAYTLDNQNGLWNYYGTSASFKTQKGFKAYLGSQNDGCIKLTFKVTRYHCSPNEKILTKLASQ